METTYNFENDDMIREMENEKENYEREFEEEDKKYKNDSIKYLANNSIFQTINENINEIINQQNKNNKSDFLKYLNNLILNDMFYTFNML